MLNAETLATIAIVISIGSPAVSFYVARRDRPRLRMEAKLENAFGGAPRIVIDLINAGRRPLILRMLGGSAKGGVWSGHYLKSPTDGIRLGESERHRETLDNDDTIGVLPGGDDVPFESLWVEDSLGVRHPVPNSRKLIAELRGNAQ